MGYAKQIAQNVKKFAKNEIDNAQCQQKFAEIRGIKSDNMAQAAHALKQSWEKNNLPKPGEDSNSDALLIDLMRIVTKSKIIHKESKIKELNPEAHATVFKHSCLIFTNFYEELKQYPEIQTFIKPAIDQLVQEAFQDYAGSLKADTGSHQKLQELGKKITDILGATEPKGCNGSTSGIQDSTELDEFGGEASGVHPQPSCGGEVLVTFD